MNTRRSVGQPIIIGIDVISIIIGSYGMYNISKLKLPPHLASGGQWQFLTNLSLAFSILVFVLGLVTHLTRSQTLFKIKNVFHAFAFITEIVVATVYWPLRLFFLNKLIRDTDVIRIQIPVDLAIHLMPVVSLGLDFFLFMPNFSITTKTAFFGCVGLTSAYWVWLLNIIDFQNGGLFPYNFLNVDSDVARALIFWGIGLSAFVQYLLMKFVYSFFIKEEIKQIEKKTQ